MSSISPTSAAVPDFEVVQEDDAVASRKVTAVMSTAIVVGIASTAISGWFAAEINGRLQVHPPHDSGVAPRQIAAIHQTMIERDRHGLELREQQRRSLDSYRWIDREHGIAQIPIDRAMQMIIDDAARRRDVR
jgi:hypothetical protein